MRLLICGSRKYDDGEKIKSMLAALPKPELVISGGAHGADTLATQAAEQLDIPYIYYMANWSRYGKSAGPRRNQEMLDKGKPTLVWAFSNDILNSPGTRDMITRSLGAGVPSTLHSSQESTSFASPAEWQAFLEGLNQ